MKVFGNIKLCGNKAKQIDKLYFNQINIPTTIIVEKSQYSKFKKSDIFNADRYILRPSHTDEDSIKKSNAGKYESIIFNTVHEVFTHLSSDHSPLSYIIQEFVTCEKYGVFFTRDPGCILEAGYYEFSNNHGGITSGKDSENNQLSYIQKKELHILGKKIDKIFNLPQDIELGIKNKQFIFFQSRPITTGNSTIYNFDELSKIHGKYIIYDFDELGEIHDYFSYKILKNIIPCIFIHNKIYIKKGLFNIYYIIKFLFFKINLQKENKFYSQYKKYLISKIKFHIIYFFSLQKLDLNILSDYYSKNKYSLQVKTKSIFNINTKYSTNKKTCEYIKSEQIKGKAFYQLEILKGEYIENISIKNITNTSYPSTLIFNKGQILNSINKKQDTHKWLQKGKINGTLVSMQEIYKSTRIDNILFIEYFHIELFSILYKVQGIIVKNGNMLSHNSIIIRENKIPCIIRYHKFHDLHAGKKITIE